jgi:hypothetical protein
VKVRSMARGTTGSWIYATTTFNNPAPFSDQYHNHFYNTMPQLEPLEFTKPICTSCVSSHIISLSTAPAGARANC